MLLRALKDALSGLTSRTTGPDAGAGENPLVSWMGDHSGRFIHKWFHYLEIYHRHFARFRGQSPVVLEIGVFHGASLDMWHAYFGPGCRVYAVDIDPRCKMFENENTRIFIGDQADRGFLMGLRTMLPRADVLIDDGGHTMNQQITTFEALFQHVKDDGVYVCEDLHTSYWKDYGGGYRESGSFVEFSKRLIDQLSAWHSPDRATFDVDDFTRAAYAMHYYDSMLVIERRPMHPPRHILAGQPSF